MKFFRIPIHAILIFIVAACTIQSSPQMATATILPTSAPLAVHFFPPHTGDQAQEILVNTEEAILKDIESLEMPLSQYSLQYRAAVFAAWNAYLYFPDDLRSETWEWKMAYYAAMGGDSDFAANIYIEKITKALNEENIPVERLSEWFQSGERKEAYATPRFGLEIQPINIPGNDQTYLIQLGVQGGIDIPGSMCLLIVEQEKHVTTHLIYDGFPDGGFFPTLRHPSYCTVQDATGDGIDEIIAHNWSGAHVGTATLQVIEISSLPPKTLPFSSSKDEQVSAWNGTPQDFINQNGKILVPMTEKLGQCDLYLTRYYEWNGKWFETANVSFSTYEFGSSILKDCYYYIPYHSDQISAREAAKLIDEAIKFYSPSSNEEKDILEQLRVEKGLIYLFSGDSDKARETFEEIANAPLKDDGIWVEPVKNFLKVYQEPSDLYRACTALMVCDPNRSLMMEDPNHPNCAIISPCQMEALDYAISSQSTTQPLADLTSNLRASGVEIASEGWLDIDQDGRDELWFMIEAPNRLFYQLWIASDYPDDINFLDAGNYADAKFEPDIKQLAPKRFSVDLGQPRKMIWTRDLTTDKPSLNSLNEWQDPNDTTDYRAINADLKEFESIQKQFYISTDRVRIYTELLAIDHRYDICPYQLISPDTFFYKYECGNYYYTIGFAAELAGDHDMAQRMYATILDTYPENPMALLAKEKLGR